MSTVEGKKQEKRRALLDAAYELFLERGTAKTSVEDITSRAKVAKGTFYLYFQDKGAVMQARQKCCSGCSYCPTGRDFRCGRCRAAPRPEHALALRHEK